MSPCWMRWNAISPATTLETPEEYLFLDSELAGARRRPSTDGQTHRIDLPTLHVLPAAQHPRTQQPDQSRRDLEGRVTLAAAELGRRAAGDHKGSAS